MNIGNSLKVARNVVTSKAGRSLLKTQKHSPVLLFGAGVIGVVATTVLASKATLKLGPLLDSHEYKQGEIHDMYELHRLGKAPEYSPALYKKDNAALKVHFVKDVTKLYAPAVVVGAASICALTGSHVILSRRLAGVTAAYATLDKAFTDYRGRVVEKFGPDTDRELKFGSKTIERAEDTENGTIVKNVDIAEGPSQYARLFSKETSNSWEPRSELNFFFLRANQNWANDQLRAKGHVFLNEVYDQLGLDRTPAGQVVGWVQNNKKNPDADGYVDFGIFDRPERFYDFMVGNEGALLLDFNVDGVVYDLI